jgi:hypothetical protein
MFARSSRERKRGMPRNILNLEQLDAFLRGVLEHYEADSFEVPHAATERWVMTSVRRWMIKEFPCLGRVIAVVAETGEGGSDDSGAVRVSWGHGAGKEYPRRGQSTLRLKIPKWFDHTKRDTYLVLDLEGVAARDLKVTLNRAIGYVQGLMEFRPRDAIARVSVTDAIAASRVLAERAEARDNRKGAATIVAFPDGCRVDVLTSADALRREGEAMRHCVGDYDTAVSGGTREILSLRDPKGRSRITLEVAGGTRVVQAKGAGNDVVPVEYQGHLRALIADLGLTWAMAEDLEAGLHRGFDPRDPNCWQRHPKRWDMIRYGEFSYDPLEHRRLLADVRAALHRGRDADVTWIRRLFVANDWRRPILWVDVEDMDVFGRSLTEISLHVADEIWETLGAVRNKKARGLRRLLGELLMERVFTVHLRNPVALISVPWFLDDLSIDWRRVRLERRESIKRAFSGHGRRGAALLRDPSIPDSKKLEWERNWQVVRDYADGYGIAYL